MQCMQCGKRARDARQGHSNSQVASNGSSNWIQALISAEPVLVLAVILEARLLTCAKQGDALSKPWVGTQAAP
jgi:hypothetical protein